MIMMQLPKEFEETTKALMGEELYNTLLRGLGSEPPVSIRLNPFKPSADLFKGYGDAEKGISMKPVPWAKDGYYLSERHFVHTRSAVSCRCLLCAGSIVNVRRFHYPTACYVVSGDARSMCGTRGKDDMRPDSSARRQHSVF